MNEVTENNIDELLATNDLVVLDLWAEWCPPCKAFGPVFEQASLNHPEITFGKVDVDMQGGISERFDIRSIPTILGFKKGELVLTHVGSMSPAKFNEFLEQLKGT